MYTHTDMHTHAGLHMHARARARTHTHTHKDACTYTCMHTHMHMQETINDTLFPSGHVQEQFLKENFESISFTPVAMDKFAQQVATLERAADVSDPASMPFSPRLSLSSRFLSRSQLAGVR